ncbi:MAG: hypothetical protein Q9198_002535 [Flavoplaca austrocitrina]
MHLHLCQFVSVLSAASFAFAAPAAGTTDVLATVRIPASTDPRHHSPLPSAHACANIATKQYEDIQDSLVAMPITNNKGLNYENSAFASTGAIK